MWSVEIAPPPAHKPNGPYHLVLVCDPDLGNHRWPLVSCQDGEEQAKIIKAEFLRDLGMDPDFPIGEFMPRAT